MKTEFVISFGGTSSPLSEQLKDSGLSKTRLEFYDKLSHGLLFCYIPYTHTFWS